MKLSELIEELTFIQQKSDINPIVKGIYNWRGCFDDAFYIEETWEEIDENDKHYLILSYK